MNGASYSYPGDRDISSSNELNNAGWVENQSLPVGTASCFFAQATADIIPCRHTGIPRSAQHQYTQPYQSIQSQPPPN